MVKRILIFFILFITISSTFAQFEDSIVSIHKQIKRETDSNKIADLYLKLAKLHRTSNLKLAEQYSIKCLNISERNNYNLGIAKAKLEMVDLFEFLKPEYSYELALDAYSIFIKEKDSLLMLRALNSLANVVYIQEDYDKAIEIYSKALNYAKQLNDTTTIPALLNNIGICVANKNDFKKAKRFFVQAINEIKTDNNDFKIIIWLNLGEINVSLKSFDSVQAIYNKVEKLCLRYNNKKAFAPLYNNYSNYYKAINKLDSAEFYARKALYYSIQLQLIDYKHDAYENLITVFKEKNKLDSVVHYYELDDILKDSISKIDKLRSIDLLTIKSDLESKMQINKLKNKQLKNRQYALILVILLFVVVLAFLLYSYNMKRKKMQLEKEKITLEKQLVEEKLFTRNREITAHILNLVSKNKLIESIIQTLNTEKVTFKKDNQQKIQSIINELRLNLNQEIWKEFEMRFKDIQPEFYNNLLNTHSTLTPSELRLCAFLKLNLASKEIALITQQNTRSIEKARVRLRKKFGIDHQEVSLSSYLTNF